MTPSRVDVVPILAIVLGLRTGACAFLLPLFFGRVWKRAAYFLTLPLPAQRNRDVMQILRPANSLRSYLRRFRGIAMTLAGGALFLALQAANALGRRRIAARLGDAMWSGSLVDDTVLHDEGDVLQERDVRDGVAVHGDDVG